MSGRGPKSQKRIAKMRRRTRRRHNAPNPALTHYIQTMAAQMQRNFGPITAPKKTRRRANANIIAAGQAILAAEAAAMNTGEKAKRIIKAPVRLDEEPVTILLGKTKGYGKGKTAIVIGKTKGQGKGKKTRKHIQKFVNAHAAAKPTFVLAPATLPGFAPYVQTNPQGLWASAQGPSLFGAIPRQTMPVSMNVVPVAAVPAAYAYNSEGQMSEDEDLLRAMKGL